MPGLMHALWDAAGVNCEILKGGEIHVGDAVHVLTTTQQLQAALGNNAAAMPVANPGEKPPGFFLHPKQRTAEMIKLGLEGRKKTYELCTARDPEGSARAERSYASVGLSFWPASCTSSKV